MLRGPALGGKYLPTTRMEHHKSKLSPEVDFSRDGRIYVTHQDATFPLRAKPTLDDADADRNFTVHGYDFDRIYNSKPKMYKKRKPLPREYAAEVAAIAGRVPGTTGNTTIASGTSSLGRKVRKKKRRRYDLQRAFDSVRSTSSMDFGYDDYSSLGRSFGSLRSVSSGSSGKLRITEDNNGGKYTEEHIQLPYIPGSKVRPRKHTNEQAPYALFVIIGVLMLLLGLSRLLLCWWHQYGCTLWTGALCVSLGVLGLFHRGDYKHRTKNTAYIVVSLMNCLAALMSCGLVLAVLFPTIRGLVQNMATQQLIYAVDFSSLNGSLVQMTVNYDMVMYLCLGFDVCTLSVLLVDLVSINAFIIVANSHWDAAYDVTGDCDHRGHPAYFNPIHQFVLGFATSFVGMVVAIVMTSPVNHGWSLVWAGLVVIVSGLVSTAYCKRCDLRILGTAALSLQVISLLSICTSTVMVTVCMVDDINVIYTEGAYLSAGRGWDLSASIFFQSVYLLSTVINIIFIIGVFFRICRQLCVYGDEPMGRETEL